MMQTPRPRSDMRIALFIDVENLVRSAETIGVPIDISPVLQKLKQYGQVQIRRSFGDLEKNVSNSRERESIRKMLHRNLVLIEDVPFITLRKNSADIRLVVEAMSVAYQYEDIDCFAVVASDRDYVPLFNKLRELGRTIVGIGIDRENMNPNYREACDVLIYYESLFGTRQMAPLDESGGGIERLLETYYDLLREAIKGLEERGHKTVGAAVVPMMRQLRSDFDPNLVGCDSFKDFVQKAAADGVILVEWPKGPGDLVVAVNPEKEVASSSEPVVPTFTAKNPQEEADYYRNVIEAKMKVTLPNVETRRRILNALASKYAEIAPGNPFNLREWSLKTCETDLRGKNAVEQTVVFKLLLGLYFARCFQCRQTGEQFNPIILALASESDTWEERLHHHFMRSIHYEDPRVEPSPQAVSLFLFEDKDHTEEAARLIDEVWNR